MKASIICIRLVLSICVSIIAFAAMAQDGMLRIAIPENSELTGELDQAKVSAKVGTSHQIASLRFLIEKRGKLRESNSELEFGSPFHVELVFAQAEEADAHNVLVTLGDGRSLTVRVLKHPTDPKRYLSKALTLDRLEDQQ